MTHNVPPLIEPPRTLIGVRAREVIILAATILPAVALLFLPGNLVLRVGAAVFLTGLGVGLAVGRDPHSHKPLEELLYDRLRFTGRARFWQRGAGALADPALRWKPAEAAEEAEREEGAWLRVRPLPLGAGLWLAIVSLSVLAGLLAWIWLGGLREIMVWFPARWGR